MCVWVRNGSFPSVGLAGALNFKSAFPIALRDPVMMATTLYSIIRGSSSSLPIYNCTLPMHIHHHNCAQKNIFQERWNNYIGTTAHLFFRGEFLFHVKVTRKSIRHYTTRLGYYYSQLFLHPFCFLFLNCDSYQMKREECSAPVLSSLT